MLVFDQGINNIEGPLKNLNFTGFKDKAKINMQNTKNCLDALVLLANSEELLKLMKDLNISEVLDKIVTNDIDDIEVQI